MVKKKGGRIKVQSVNTGLTLDGHVEDINELTNLFKDKWQTKQRTDLQYSLTIYRTILSSSNFRIYKKTINKNLYRLTFGNCFPLDIAGSLADGGRFNIGGAQGAIANKFFSMKKGACIYCADSLPCAKAETQFARNADVFLLQPKKPLNLIDLEKTAINFSGYSNLKKDLDISPFSAKWDLQSVPTVSQIFVTYLRDNFDFDGVFYPSTKYARCKNVAIFIPQGKTGANFFKKKKLNC